MRSFKSLVFSKLACCALVAALCASCSDPPEALEYEKDTELLKGVVRDARQDVTRKSDELRKLKAEKRDWERSNQLEELRAEVEDLRAERDAAKAELAEVEDQFEAMKSARLP